MDAKADANAKKEMIPEQHDHLDDHAADVAPKPKPVVDHHDIHDLHDIHDMHD